MPFPPNGLPQRLIAELSEFQDKNDFIELYKSFSWRSDEYENGFPDILNLEATLIESDRSRGISLQDVKRVASWGRLRNPGRIKGKEIVLPQMALHRDNGSPTESLSLSPVEPVRILESNIEKGIGPTYLSKVLRFGLPQEYGAIDTRCVRVFGEGDHHVQRHNWLDLRGRNDGYGWFIPKTQRPWPSAYGTWLNVLRFFSHQLPNNCPHPKGFVDAGLRLNNEWACADIEMALFAYASQFTK
jgi:hypothetical protein